MGDDAILGRRARSVYPGSASLSGGIGLNIPNEPWVAEAVCAQTDPEAFFPEKGGSTRPAKAICAQCTVTGACLDYALAHDEPFGVWGGLSRIERIRLSRGGAA